MSKTSNYWKMRELENRNRQQTLEFIDSYNKHIDQTYRHMLDAVQKEIDAFYGRYADKEGITIAEAKKRVSQLDIEAYARKAKRYVANKTFTPKANEEMRIYNLTMKINRLELLKSNIGLELVDGFDDLEKYFGEKITDEGINEFRRQAGILGDTIFDTDADKRYEKLADRMARASFHNATFSDRIWMHQDLLKGEIDKALQRAMISGASMERLARDIRNSFGVSTKNAQRLMRTEIRRMQTDVALESYKRNGNEEYEYMALGQHPCDICRALDGKIFKVKDMKIGVNASPMHPNCFCSTAPHVDEKAYQEWLDSFDEWKEFSLDDEEGYKKWSNAYNARNMGNLTQKDIENIREYTDGSYELINGAFRYAKGSAEYVNLCNRFKVASLDKYAQIGRDVSKAIGKFEPVPENIIVHKYVRNVDYITGLDSSVASIQYSVGSSYHEKAFNSTCIFPEITSTFGGKTPIHLVIQMPKGTRAAYINEISEKKNLEFEFLIDKGYNYKVIDGGERTITVNGYNPKTRRFEPHSKMEKYMVLRIIK